MGKHEAVSANQPNKAAAGGKKKNRKKTRVVLIVVLAIVVISGLVVAGYLLTPPDPTSVVAPPKTDGTGSDNTQTQQEQQDELDETGTVTKVNYTLQKGVYTVLLAGTTDSCNTDTMILCSVNTKTNKINMVSINRDTQIDVSAKNKKINGTYGRGGVEEMCAAVTEITGVPINYYVVINMDSFKDLVDLIGGVYYDVPMDMRHGDRDVNFNIDLKAGYQLLDGTKAAMFVRYRSTSENDFGRVDRQKSFLLATLKQVKANFSVTQIQDYIKIFNENVKTNMSVHDMIWFYLNVCADLDYDKDVSSYTLPHDTTGYYKNVSYVYLKAEDVVAFVNQYLNPYTTDLTVNDVNIVHLQD